MAKSTWTRAGGAPRPLSADPSAVKERERKTFARELQRFLESVGEDEVLVARKLGVPLVRAHGLVNGTVFANESESEGLRRLMGIAASAD